MAKVLVVVLVFFIFELYFSSCLQLGRMTGGISRMNETNISGPIKEGVRQYLKSITEPHSAFEYKVKCDKLEVSSQVVQGTMYRVALEIVPVEKDAIHSDCIHGSDNFRLDKKDVQFVCLEIWSRLWLDPPERLIVTRVDGPRERNDVESCLEENEIA